MTVDQIKSEDADNIPTVPLRDPISKLGSANAPTLFFDENVFFGAINGVGEIALAATRYCDIVGSAVQSERVLVGHLRGSLQALRTLSYSIEAVIKMLETERDREVAARQAMAMREAEAEVRH